MINLKAKELLTSIYFSSFKILDTFFEDKISFTNIPSPIKLSYIEFQFDIILEELSK
jgi:hypothetical protein